MRNLLLIFCSTLVIHSSISAQSSWFKIHDLGFKHEEAVTVIPFGNDFILMTFSQNDGGTKNEVIRLDQFGEIKWRSIVSYPLSADANIIVYYADGIVASKDSCIYHFSGSKSLAGKSEFLINKFDKDGQLIWYKSYGIAGKNIQPSFNGLDISSDSLGVIMSGSDVGSGKLSVCQIDSSGEVIWHKIINVPLGGNAVGYITPVVVLPDQSIKVAYDNCVLTNYHDHLVSLNANGNLEYSFANPLTGKTHDLKRHPNGNLVYLSNERNPPMPEYGGLRIQMLTPEFDTVWSHLFYDTQFPYLFLETGFVRNLSISPEGKILALGYNTTNCVLLCYDAQGTLLWKREVALEDFDGQKFNSMTWASDGGILLDGYIYGTENNQRHDEIFLLKMDSVGCLVPGCDQTIITGTKEIDLLKTDFDISPNPTQGDIKITYKGADQNKIRNALIKVHDSNGKLVFQKNFELNGQPVALNQLASGAYVVSITNGQGVIYVSKIVKI